jgi:hypothetical protein
MHSLYLRHFYLFVSPVEVGQILRSFLYSLCGEKNVMQEHHLYAHSIT